MSILGGVPNNTLFTDLRFCCKMIPWLALIKNFYVVN